MNIHELKLIVEQLKSNVSCPKCSSCYHDQNIDLVGAINDDHCVFLVDCPHCESESFINVCLETEEMEHISNFPQMEEDEAPAGITTNDILDMHNFLKDFKGDFRSLFQKENN